jgi:outer membrane protein TolC
MGREKGPAFHMSLLFRRTGIIAAFLAGLLLVGCSTTYYKEDADKEVYGIISAKSGKIGGMPSHFTIEGEKEPLPFDPDAESEVVLSLESALKIAVENSRDYQGQKESLYSQGLSLTQARHQFDPIFSGTASGEIERDDQRNSISGALSFGISKMLATGADLSVVLTTNLFRYISGGDPAKAASSIISASIVQPLLEGAGRAVTLENLTQAERNMVYEIRDFVRFRKTLSVSVAKDYYNLLQRNDAVNNAWNNYENLKDELERSRLLAMAGRLPEFQVDQTEQDELRARDRWIREKELYENLLDSFKIRLGIPTDVSIQPDPGEMAELAKIGIVPPPVQAEEATDIALDKRLDLRNTRGQVDDADRKVTVAANALKAGLDVSGSMDVGTQGETTPFDFDFDNATYSAGLSLELPLDKKSERNAYRQSLINLMASERNLAERIDEIKQEVRNASRSLEQAEQSYDIQQNSLRLAEQRVESTTLLQQAGRASTRDVLESREALLSAQNAVSRALVDHFNARLDLLLAMESLKIRDDGLWMEEFDDKT